MAVGLVIMSERELNRIEVLSQVTQGRMTAVTTANVLGLSRSQVHRLLKDFQTDGPGSDPPQSALPKIEQPDRPCGE